MFPPGLPVQRGQTRALALSSEMAPWPTPPVPAESPFLGSTLSADTCLLGEAESPVEADFCCDKRTTSPFGSARPRAWGNPHAPPLSAPAQKCVRQSVPFCRLFPRPGTHSTARPVHAPRWSHRRGVSLRACRASLLPLTVVSPVGPGGRVCESSALSPSGTLVWAAHALFILRGWHGAVSASAAVMGAAVNMPDGVLAGTAV